MISNYQSYGHVGIIDMSDMFDIIQLSNEVIRFASASFCVS